MPRKNAWEEAEKRRFIGFPAGFPSPASVYNVRKRLPFAAAADGNRKLRP
ncbi:hypothetical protein HMPREF0294_1786 [Corynebacterium glucuronolyticum ATCC 51867]|uniref:Uncharacterized protein n=1 Tax=Corynebacterium glucuronolyticum ATCC 51866 TaxID=548478 RepID=A0ABP2DPX5_9CORY|nr:hypothetical protein HMPREF0294_1786 [Corynebacterium glucuronolyticum ATCC 51867]EEI62021.1 hypothetical protein HMPREF0293_2559 [Corynebacterium glucuronolyticum ATCC 51866]